MEKHQQATGTTRKSRGFAGQKMIALPEKVIAGMQSHPLSKPLYITHIGYFPKARFHYRERPDGASQFILNCCLF